MKIDNRCVIYQIKNAVTGDIYVGSAKHANQRWHSDKSVLRRNLSHNLILQNAWNLYGEDNFSFEILEVVSNFSELLEREQFYIDTLNPKYNICRTAGNRLGVPLSDEAVAKMRQKLKGLKRSISTRLAISRYQRTKRYGALTRHRISLAKQNISDETRAKMSAAAKLRGVSNKASEAAARVNTGKHRSAETKAKISATKLEKKEKKPWLSEANKDPERMTKAKDGRERYWAEYRRKKAEQGNQ
jgi:group I intron endonuclease